MVIESRQYVAVVISRKLKV